MHFNLSVLLSILALVAAKPVPEDETFSLDDFFGAFGDGHFANMEVDGIETMLPKKTEKLPGQKKMVKPELVEQPAGVVPEFTGGFAQAKNNKQEIKSITTTTEESKKSAEESDADYFAEASGPVTNPASTFLEGADFEKIAQPKCQMLGCTGPIPNDGSYAALSSALEGKACSQLFVPMNGCTDNKGYPMGMLCSVCCDCSNPFVAEMKKTFGYKSNIQTSVFSN